MNLVYLVEGLVVIAIGVLWIAYRRQVFDWTVSHSPISLPEDKRRKWRLSWVSPAVLVIFGLLRMAQGFSAA